MATCLQVQLAVHCQHRSPRCSICQIEVHEIAHAHHLQCMSSQDRVPGVEPAQKPDTPLVLVQRKLCVALVPVDRTYQSRSKDQSHEMGSDPGEIASRTAHPDLRKHRECLHPHSAHPHPVRVAVAIGIRVRQIPHAQCQGHNPEYPHRITVAAVCVAVSVRQHHQVHSHRSHTQIEQREQNLANSEIGQIPVEHQRRLAAKNRGHNIQYQHLP
mmetsp:Transcript_15989/g.36611  ORF Transcript_15989/g.36611 Transcript_15989/m.36611 type:complete len:214 (+) Transcript_15989:93-734(+)